MPIAPWNPGGFYPFTYGTSSSPFIQSSSNPLSRTAQSTLSGTDLTRSAQGSGSGSDITGQTISNNLASAPDLTSLTNLVNQLNIGAQQTANAARIPNATGLEAQSSANIGSELGGNLPPDIIRLLGQQAAERGVAMGSPGSDNVNSSLLRALGLSSLDLQQLGQQDLTAAYARNPVAKLFDPTSQLITPYQQGSLNNQANQLALDWYRTLHPNIGNTGGGRGGYGGGQPTSPTAPDMSWFSRALGQAANLNQPNIGVPAVGLPPQTTYGANPILDTDFGFGGNAPLQPISDTDFGFGDTSSYLDAPSGYDPFASYG